MGKDNRKYSDRAAYLCAAVSRRRRRLRQMAIASKGSRCERCGYSRCTAALDFHHSDADQKDFGLSERGMTRSWTRIKEEISKCVLVCANCHRELHDRISSSRK